MKQLSKLLITSALLGALVTPALAQVNSVPQVGTLTNTIRQKTYYAASVNLVPASAATDIMCIAGSPARTITLRELILTGTATTAISTPVLIYRRALLDTGGTAATGLALPVPAVAITNDGPSVATTTAYTANPTINDSSPALLFGASVSFNTTTTNAEPDVYTFGSAVDFYAKGLDILKGSTQQLCLNLNGATITGGSLTLTMVWVEN